MRRNGFTLVELSIVLVILGLLVGGVLAGQNLIRAAELRSVTTEFNQYQTAVMAFREKYFALPGDLKNATAFWGIAAGTTGNDATCQAAASTDGTTCNGDANGVVGNYGSSTCTGPHCNEAMRSYQHLTNAGLIEGNYNGVFGSTLSGGVNVPVSKLSNTLIGFFYRDNHPIWGRSGHVLQFGSVTSGGLIFGGIISAEEAWNIDTKMDDGLPDKGNLRAVDGAGSGGLCHNGDGTDVQTPNSSTTYTYELSATGNDCNLYFFTGY